jgi:hypothetical protein
MAVAAGNVPVPAGLTDSHFKEIQGYLAKLLGELQKEGAKRVTSRINYSDTDNPAPVWAGNVEDNDIKILRRDFDPGKVRFGQSNRSAVYEEAVMDPNGSIIERDWGQSLPEKSKGGYTGHALGPKAGCRYQVFIAVRIKHEGGFRHIATITAGFEKPSNMNAIRPIMQKWATDGSPYVEYLKNTFILGGPKHT